MIFNAVINFVAFFFANKRPALNGLAGEFI